MCLPQVQVRGVKNVVIHEGLFDRVEGIEQERVIRPQVLDGRGETPHEHRRGSRDTLKNRIIGTRIIKIN